MEFLSNILSEFYKTIKWSDANYYSNLDEMSLELLDFKTPNYLSIGIGKHITDNLKSAYSIGLVNEENSVAYLFSSALLPENPSIFQRYKQGPWKPNTLLYGRIFQNGKLEGIACHHLTPRTLMLVTGVNTWQSKGPKSESNVQAQLIQNMNNFCGELNYNSDNQILGFSGLGHITEKWAIGTELYYTAKEKSGGCKHLEINDKVSLGMRYKSTESGLKAVTSFIANPVMGHYTSSYAAQVRPHIKMATRYDFNIYSYDADVSVAIEIAPRGKDQKLNARFSLLNVSISD
ncbi:Mitochondrial distribution and morphology protein 10 [Globomyces sp. JEL0801]|nr:Mitochondrial distribution and morphology protein 10 [Globomyces sp. JEL0801]